MGKPGRGVSKDGDRPPREKEKKAVFVGEGAEDNKTDNQGGGPANWRRMNVGPEDDS